MGKRISAVIEGLRTTYPSASNPYWRSLPLRKMRRLLVGTFLLASVAGFAANLTMLDHRAILYGFFWPVLIACVATSIFVIRLRSVRWMILAFPVAVGIFLLAGRLQSRPQELPDFRASRNLHRRLLFNAFGIWLSAALGSRVIISFLSTTGVANVRMQTELALAHGIQGMLVPAISYEGSRFEVYGISVPSTEMGGDLVDMVRTDRGLLAYVADVSGHGLPAGQLMGMLKTAMRVSLAAGQEPITILENADRVLPAIKEPHMYATVALLHFKNSSEVEYSVAGHPPILHYRKQNNSIVRLAMEQLPLGLLPGAPYASALTSYGPGDVFVVVTDGIVEVFSESAEEFGLERVEHIILTRAFEPLRDIWESIRGAVLAYGPQHDDQSGLLIRVL